MHPVTERFLLIEKLDRLGIAIGIAFLLGWWVLASLRSQRRDWGRIVWIFKGYEFLGVLLMLAACTYLVWRFFFAWKGIYY